MMNFTESSAAENLYDLATNGSKLPIVDRKKDALPFKRQLADSIELLP